MFEVETVFLFPWAVIARELGAAGLLRILFFGIEVFPLIKGKLWRKARKYSKSPLTNERSCIILFL